MQDNFDSAQWNLLAATDVRPETPRELHQYVRTYCRNENGEKLIIPARRMCEGHQAPFEFVSDAFFGVHQNQFVIAPRTGGKTIDFGLIAWLGMKHLGRDYPLQILDIGAIQAQADKCFEYTSSIWRQPEFFHECGRNAILKQSIRLPNGTSLSTGVATITGVNSPHVPWLHLDEWELWDWAIGQQAFSIPKSAGPHRASIRIASTQKYAMGNVQRFKEECTQRGFKSYKWCVWETLEQCKDRVCSQCKIFNWPDLEGGELCGGRAKEARGYFTIDDFIAMVQKLDRNTLEEEWLCLRPSRQGLVFGRDYNEDLHRTSFEIPYNPSLPLSIAIDQGYTNPFAVLIVQEDTAREQLLIIGELYQTETIPEHMGRDTADYLERLGVEDGKQIAVIADPEDPAAAKTFVKHLTSTKGRRYHGSLKRPSGKQDFEEHLRLCRRRLKLTPGRPARIVMSARVRHLPYELTQYRYPEKRREDKPITEKPVDKDNHAISAWYRFEGWIMAPAKATSGHAEIM